MVERLWSDRKLRAHLAQLVGRIVRLLVADVGTATVLEYMTKERKRGEGERKEREIRGIFRPERRSTSSSGSSGSAVELTARAGVRVVHVIFRPATAWSGCNPRLLSAELS